MREEGEKEGELFNCPDFVEDPQCSYIGIDCGLRIGIGKKEGAEGREGSRNFQYLISNFQ